MALDRPNFMIVGAQKAGTTSLYYYLNQHDDVFMPTPKELHFFDTRESITKNAFDRYLKKFKTRDSYLAKGEATPIYMFYPQSLEKIKAVLPQLKIIIIVRDPVRRAYSHYWYEVSRGWENKSFLEAINRDPDDSDLYLRHHSYVERSRYSGQLERAFEVFGRENVLVIKFEELVKSPVTVTNSVLTFINTSLKPLTSVESSPRNVASIPKYQWVLSATAKLNYRFGRNLVSRLLILLNRGGQKYPALSDTERKLLEQTFRQTDSALQDLYPELFFDEP